MTSKATSLDPEPKTRIVELRNITAYRGDTCVFDGLSLDLDVGENAVVLGPNGSGKSTLLKLLSREIYPVVRSDSQMRLFGRERWDVWDLRSHLGIVSHELQHTYRGAVRGIDVVLSGLYASVGVYDHQPFSESDVERAHAIARSLDIGALAERPFGKMSTGQQRRFLLARALIHGPDTLVLDEPTSGLDLTACFHYLDTIRSLMREGKTLILVTHHLHEIPPEITRVILLKAGRIVADGEKATILTSQALSELFDVPVRVIESDGYYQALPG